MIIICAMIALILMSVLLEGQDRNEYASTDSIKVVPSDGLNLRIVRYASPDIIELSPSPVSHQWFSAKFANLPTDREVALRLLMEGNDVGINPANVRKWVGLCPVISYADPNKFESYEWYRRGEDGRWRSGDVSQRGRDAGDGLLPMQQVYPAELARLFLSEDGNYWSPWGEIETVETDLQHKVFTIRHQFARPTATVAIHYPYTYSYLQTFLSKLRAAAYPGVHIDEIGVTREGRRLQMIRVEDPDHPSGLHLELDALGIPHIQIAPPAKKNHNKRVMVIITREHGTEHSSSRVLHGALQALVADTKEARALRKDTIWLLLPIYNPDGSAHAEFSPLRDGFFLHAGEQGNYDNVPAEIISYARYLRAFVNSGRPIISITAFYCLECNEGKTVLSPIAINCDRMLTIDFNKFWFKRLKANGILTGLSRPWHSGWCPRRMYGWCGYVYGALALTFEVNDRYPEQRLTLEGLDNVGASYVHALTAFYNTPQGQARAEQTRAFLRNREQEMAFWYQTSMSGTLEEPSPYDLLTVGY